MERPMGQCSICLRRVPAGSGRCERHRGDGRPSPARKGYGRLWRRRRAVAFEDNPFCEVCGAVALDKHRDHIWPKEWGGSDDDENLWGLCSGCHSRKTNLEKSVPVDARRMTAGNVRAWSARLAEAGFLKDAGDTARVGVL